MAAARQSLAHRAAFFLCCLLSLALVDASEGQATRGLRLFRPVPILIILILTIVGILLCCCFCPGCPIHKRVSSCRNVPLRACTDATRLLRVAAVGAEADGKHVA